MVKKQIIYLSIISIAIILAFYQLSKDNVSLNNNYISENN